MPGIRPLFRWLCPFLLLLGLSPGGAAAPAEPPAPREEIEALIRRLESPAEREALVRQLRLLLEAQKGEKPAPAESSPPAETFYAGLMQAAGGALRRGLAASPFGGRGSREGLRFLVTASVLTLLILAAALLLSRLAQGGTARLFALGRGLGAWVPGIERRLLRYRPITASGLVLLIWALAALLALSAWGVPALDALLSQAGLSLL
ncbi:MAG: hypothetical protein AABZ64_03475, partial [Nitrospinota bacterium]